MNLPPDLETTLAAWRESLRVAGITSTTSLDELESHVRERVVDRMARGQDPLAALGEAIGALGTPSALKREFAEVGTDRRLSHRACVGIGLSVATLMIAWWRADVWFPGLRPVVQPAAVSCIVALPFLFAFVTYHAVAWRATVAGGRDSHTVVLGSLRTSLWLTGAFGVLWWSAATDWLVSLLVTYLLVGLLLVQSAAIAGLARYTARRLRFDLIAALTLLVILVSAAWTSWPTRLLFLVSRNQLESLATRVDAGESVRVPVWAGGFRIARVETRKTDWGGGTHLWVNPKPGGPTGFVRRGEGDRRKPGINVNRRIQLDDRWYFVSED